MSRSNRSFRARPGYVPALGWWLALALVTAPFAPARGAVTLIDHDADGASSFNTAGNWDSGAEPSANNDYFTDNFVLRTPTSGSHTFAGDSLTVQSGGTLALKTPGPITVGNLILSGGVVGQWSVGGTEVAVLAGSATLDNGTTSRFDVADGRTLEVNSAITGSGSFRVTGGGSGLVVLGGANNYTGTAIVDGGRLRVTAPAALPTDVTVNAGGTFDVNALGLGSRSFTIAGAGSAGQVGALVNTTGGAEAHVGGVNLSANATIGTTATKLNIGGSIQGNGHTLTIAGSGEVNIRSDNALNNLAGITVSSGRLRLESSHAPATPFAITVNSGAILDSWGARTYNANLGLNLNGGRLESQSAGTAAWHGPVSVSANSQVTANQRIDFWNDVSGPGIITKAGGNVLNFRGGVTNLGGLVINAGRVRFEGTGLGAWTGPVTVNSGGILSPYNDGSTAAAITLAGGTLSVENNGTATWNGNIVFGNNSTLDAPNSGSHIINGSLSGSGLLTKAGGGYARLEGTLALTGNATISIAAGRLDLFGTVDGGSHVLTKTGTGNVLNFRGGVTSLGGLVIDAGRVRFEGAGLGAWTGPVTVNSGGILSPWGVQSTVAAITLAGGTLSVENNGTATYSGPVNLSASSFVDTAGGNVVLSNAVSGAGMLTKLGAGMLTLSGTNNYGGGTTVNDGTLRVNSPASLPAAGTTIINAPATLELLSGGTNTFSQAFAGDGRILLTFSGGTNNTYLNGNSSGFTGTLELAGSGGNKLNTSGLNISPSALIRINSGAQLFLSGGSNLANPIEVVGTGNTENRGAIRLQSGTLSGTVSLLGNATIGKEGGSLTGNIVSGAAGTQTLTLGTSNSAGTLTLSGSIADGVGTLALTNSHGTTILTGSNTYSGTTTISGGTLQVGAGGTAGTLGSGAVVNNAALVFHRSDAADLNLGRTTSGSGTVTYRGTGTTNQSRYFVGQDNTYSGGTTIDRARVNVQHNNAFGSGPVEVLSGGQIFFNASNLVLSNPLTISGNGWSESTGTLGAIRLAQNGTVAGPVTLAGNARVTAHSSGDSGNISGNISGPYGLEKTGAGTVVLSGNSTYGGATHIAAGTMRLVGAPTQNPVTSGLSWALDASDTSSINAGSPADGDPVSVWTASAGPTVGQTNVPIQPTFHTDVQNGLPVIRFSGTDNSRLFSGSTNAAANTMFIVNSPDDLKSYAGIVGGTGQGGTSSDNGIRRDPGTATAWRHPGDGNDFTNPGGSRMWINGAATNSFAGLDFHLLTATRNGGAMRFNAVGGYYVGREFRGDVGEILAFDRVLTPGEIDAVEFYLNRKWFGLTDVLPADTAVTIDAGAQLELVDVTQRIGSLAGPAGSSVLIDGSSVLIVGGIDTSTTFSGSIAGNGGLTKTGTGTLTLAGPSTYTGATNVDAGTLMVNGSLANTAVAVNSGGTLGGTGGIGGAVTVHGGGLLSPGASTGVLTMGSLVLETNSTTFMEIDGLLRGDEYDGIDIAVEDGLTYGGTLSLAFNLAGWVPAGTVFDLFDFTGTHTGAFDEVVSTGFYTGGTDDWVYDSIDDMFSLEFGWQTLLFSHATGDLTVIPEPGTWLLLLAAAACGLLLRRRK